MTDAAEQIAERNKERHSHPESNTDRCDRCGSYVSTGEPDSAGRVRYKCGVCGHAGLGFVYDPSKTRNTIA